MRRRCAQPIERCGGNYVGYYLPTKIAGPTNTALGLIDFPNLAAYEQYRARLLTDPDGVECLRRAEAAGCILNEDRAFVRRVTATSRCRGINAEQFRNRCVREASTRDPRGSDGKGNRSELANVADARRHEPRLRRRAARRDVVNTALHSIGTSLGGGVAELQWIVTPTRSRSRRLILTAGALGDRVGAKRVFMAGFVIFTAASLGCALAPNPMLLIAARGDTRIGAAVLVPNSLALLQPCLSGRRGARPRGRHLGGRCEPHAHGRPLAGGVLIASVGWRSIFLVNLPIGLGALWLTWRYAMRRRAPHRELDLPGQARRSARSAASPARSSRAARGAGATPWVLAGFVAAVLCDAVRPARAACAQPMLPLSLFRAGCSR